jgi:putative membrane protein
MMHEMMERCGQMPVFGMVFMFLFFGAVIFVTVVVVRWLLLRARARGAAMSQESPVDIVKGRYARGEISREEFERIFKDLER